MKYFFQNNGILLAVLFAVATILGSAVWYAKKNGTTVKDALLLFWREGILSGFADLRAAFIPTVKALLRLWWNLLQRAIAFVVALVRPVPVKHQFTADLEAAILAAVSGFIYVPFQPVIDVRYTPAPSYIYVSLYTKAAVTEEVKAEITWAVLAAFREYLAAYGLDWPHTAIPYTKDNRVEVYLYYADRPADVAAYQAQVDRVLKMMSDPAPRPLPADELPKTGDIVLGCAAEPWDRMEQKVPIVWDLTRYPSALIAGPSGSGKTTLALGVVLALRRAGAELYIADYKAGGDWRNVAGARYAEYEDCDSLMAEYHDRFCQAKATRTPSPWPVVLVFDELNSYALAKEPKDFRAFMNQLRDVALQGRAYNYHILGVGQQFSAAVLETGIRESFETRLYCGRSISAESARMLFPGCDIDLGSRLAECRAYCTTPERGFEVIALPKYEHPEHLREQLRGSKILGLGFDDTGALFAGTDPEPEDYDDHIIDPCVNGIWDRVSDDDFDLYEALGKN